ncbi:MAG TPA: sulfatase-like hydrolase/transferase [Thermodesulfobacteriota bacterium]|nr:sulfatase-like hydrolase/transferase [Thermodesulfobacteriota bacterium]
MKATSNAASWWKPRDKKVVMKFVAVSFVLTIFLFGTLVLSFTSADISTAQTPARPNIVVIMTDDQDIESMRVMPKTINRIGGSNGTTFNNFFTSFSYCCPSRATFITGQYSHNHGVEDNVPPYGGYGKLDHSNTLPVWLQKAGYHTVHIGKWLNGYGTDNTDQTEVPPGWNDWQGLVDPGTYKMYDYTINDNGTLVTYGSTVADYQTDVLVNRAVAVIKERAGQAEPFSLTLPLLPLTANQLFQSYRDDPDLHHAIRVSLTPSRCQSPPHTTKLMCQINLRSSVT